MTLRIHGQVRNVGTSADVFNWSDEQLRRYNPLAPRSKDYPFDPYFSTVSDGLAPIPGDPELLSWVEEAVA